MTIGFIGLGLIGGSLAKTIRRIYPETRMIAYNRSASVVTDAMREGVIDQACFEITSAFSECDIIFLCVPVISMRSMLKVLAGYLKPGAIISDVGSTKQDILYLVRELGLEGHYIGGHPMAGSEKSGYRASTDRLLENAWYVLTPGAEIPIQKLSRFSDFISSLGAVPLLLSAEEHDFMTAGISHLPHVVSASLVNLVHDLDDSEGTMKMIAAGGFKDITRISSSSPQMWQEICLTNADNICIVLDKFMQKLTDFRFAIRNENGAKLLEYFTACKDYRDSFANNSAGPIRRAYRLRTDLIDQVGAIADVAQILANAGISIKNIGVVHNRGHEQGTLEVDFYSEEAMRSAAVVLREKRYPIYEDE